MKMLPTLNCTAKQYTLIYFKQQMVEQRHQMHHQQTALQNGNTSNQNMSNSSQSHMNYLITAPNANRPQQQRPLPSYVPSSQIQQIIGKISLIYIYRV